MIYFLFFISGASSLIYEVIWVKLFSLVFGNTTFAVSAVLSSFFAGLALGSYLVGHYSDRYRGRYLYLYGILELLIGLYALMLPKLIPAVHFVYFPLIQNESLGFYELSFIRFILAFGLMIVPTTMMGATFPVLSKFFVKEVKSLGNAVGRLYAFNTFGATVGVFLAGFVLLAVMGISKTNLLAVILNGIAGIAAIYFSRREERGGLSIPGRGNTRHTFISYLLLSSFAISGFCAMGYEVVWIRVLSVSFGPTTYSFSIMLTTVLAGLALGSLVMARHVDRLIYPLLLFGILEVFIGILAAWMLPLFKQLPAWFIQINLRSDISWYSLIAVKSFIAIIILLPPTILLGATFPLIGKLYAKSVEKVGGLIGNVYAVNTVGGIFGSSAAGFVLLPFWGIKTSILMLAVVNVSLGTLIMLFDPNKRMKINVGLVGAVMFGVSIVFFFDYQLVPEDKPGKMEVLFYKEDVAANVMVVKEKQDIELIVNGRVQGITKGKWKMKKLGHVPLLLHPNPKRVLVVGLGTGISAGAIGRHDVDRVDVVEIVPSLIETLSFFKKQNHDILNDPRFRFIIGDGRNFMVLSGDTYDVIVSDVYHPDVAGIGNLYAKEYYEAVEMRLNNGGLFAQWVALHQMGPKEFQSIMATMHQVFPFITVWVPIFLTPDVVALIIAGNEEMMIDPVHIKRRLEDPKIAREIIEKDNVYSLLSSYVMDEKSFETYLEGAVVNTDDIAYIEYSTPKIRWELNLWKLAEKNLSVLQQFAQPIISHLSPNGNDSIQEEIMKYYRVRKQIYQARTSIPRGDLQGRLSAYLQAETIDVNDYYLHSLSRDTHQMLYNKLRKQGDLQKAQKHLEVYKVMKEISSYDDLQVFSNRAFRLAQEKKYGASERILLKAIDLAPDEESLHSNLKSLYRMWKIEDRAEMH